MRTTTITINGETDWTLRSAEIVESLCTPGAITAEVTHESAVDPADLLGTWISFEIPTLLPSRPTRWAGGLITRCESVSGTANGLSERFFKIQAAAPQEIMTLRRQTREFSGMSVLDICRDILGEWGERVPQSRSPLLVLDNEPADIPLQHIRQTGESDLQFVQRLLHQAGVFTINNCNGPKLTDTELILGTISGAADAWTDDMGLQYQLVTGAPERQQITNWRRTVNLVPSTPVVATWHPSVADNHLPSNPTAMHASPSSQDFDGWEFIEHPLGAPQAGAQMSDLRDQLSKVREAALHQERHWRNGAAASTTIVPGTMVEPKDLPDGDEGRFFVTACRLVVLGDSFADQIDLASPVCCAFTALPEEVPFRPPIRDERMEPPGLESTRLAAALDALHTQEAV
ncbi:MAG: phage late control D family protein [Phycisphaerales bacterium]|nr:phage late control D family protein [Phycisphaerales bacterium]